MTKRRKVARLDRAHLLNVVRKLRAGVLRQRDSERAADAAGNHMASMWAAGARYAYRFAALSIARELRRQQNSDDGVRRVRPVRRRRGEWRDERVKV